MDITYYWIRKLKTCINKNEKEKEKCRSPMEGLTHRLVSHSQEKQKKPTDDYTYVIYIITHTQTHLF